MRRVENLIGGEKRPPAAGVYTQILDPASGAAIATAASSTAADVEDAIDAADRAFPAWSQAPPAERSRALLKIADALEENAEELAALESLDVGKPITAAREEIPFIVDSLRFFAGAGRSLQGPAAGEYVRAHTSMVRREPVGVCGLITPWNYPLMMAAWKIGPALAAGNTAVLKPAEVTPLSTARLADLAADHLPAGVLNLVLGAGPELRGALLDDYRVAMVALTGSTETGRAVAAAAARSLKRVHLELGGKAPVIVFADADLDQVREGLRVASFTNAGQDCTAATRVLVEASREQDLVGELERAAVSLEIGEPSSARTDLGPLVSADQRDRVERMIADRPADSELVTGGARARSTGFYLEPTVIAGLATGHPLTREEIFGPVVTVETFTEPEEAIEIANDVSYGLAASVWTKDGGRALDVARKLSFGAVWINAHMVFSSELPHSGRRETGYGSDLSVLSLEDYTVPKQVTFRLEEGA